MRVESGALAQISENSESISAIASESLDKNSESFGDSIESSQRRSRD